MTNPMNVVTVTLNPAIDQTVFVEDLAPGTVHRASSSSRQAGGKGINVATMLSLGGTRVAVTGILGADNPTVFERHFKVHNLADAFVRIPGDTRTGIKIISGHSDETTDINLPGLKPSAADKARLVSIVRKLARRAPWVVIAGSLPEGISPDFLVELITCAKAQGASVAVDTSGEALAAAIEAGIDLAKPNVHELADVLATDLSDFPTLVEAATELRLTKVPNLVVSLGGEGALFLTPEAELMAGAPRVKVVSTVGAGDSLLAGFIKARLHDFSPADTARLATVYAWSRLENLQPQLPSPAVIRERMDQISVQALASFNLQNA